MYSPVKRPLQNYFERSFLPFTEQHYLTVADLLNDKVLPFYEANAFVLLCKLTDEEIKCCCQS